MKNLDQFLDFAVGAPYDGPDELGAVYIYHGTKMGVRQKYSQLIRSEDVSILGRPISTFGFSVSGGTDLDNNLYPDLIIGAYESDMAYFMKSRPVAQMNTSVYFKSDNKQISLERRECTTKDGTWVPCLFLGTCLQYTGIGIDDQLSECTFTLFVYYFYDLKYPRVRYSCEALESGILNTLSFIDLSKVY